MTYRSRTKVEVGFDAAVGTLDPSWTDTGFTWTDLSTVAVEYTTKRGGPEMSGVSPGSLALLLDNSTGDLDPSNASGAYYPNLISGKPIRVREQLNLLSASAANGEVADLTAITSTLVDNTVDYRTASNCIAVSRTAGASFQFGWTTATGTAGFPVFPGEPLTGSFWWRKSSAGARTCTASLLFYDAAGSLISTVVGTGVVSTTSYQQLSVVTTAPATAAFAALRFLTDATTTSMTFYCDNLSVVPSAANGNLAWYPGGPVTVFRGSVDSWLPVQHHPTVSETRVAATGTLGQVAAAPVGSSLWETFVGLSKPTIWWRFGEDDENQPVADSSRNTYTGRYRRVSANAPAFGTGLIAQDDNGAVTFTAADGHYVEGPTYTFGSGVTTMAFWLTFAPGAAACTIFDSSSVTVAMSAGGLVTATVRGVASVATSDIRDGVTHLFYVTFDVAGVTVQTSLDGATASLASGAVGAVQPDRIYVGRNQAGSGYMSGTIDELVLWDGVIPSPAWLYRAGTAGTPYSSIGAAGMSTIGPIDVAQFLLDITTSPQALGNTSELAVGHQPRNITMSGTLDMLGVCSTAGQTIVYEAYANAAISPGQPTVAQVTYTPTVPIYPAITIGQDTSAGELPYAGTPTVDYGEASVINEISITRPGMATLTYRDQTSIDARGTRPITLTMWTDQEPPCRDLANWLLSQYATEGRRLTAITPDCTRIDTGQAMLHVDINDVITIKDLTVDGRTITTIARVTGKTVTKARNGNGLGVLAVALDVSPVRIQPMILNSSTYGVLGAGANTGKWGP